jgi:Spy/CpxP family protein refolding chaperone
MKTRFRGSWAVVVIGLLLIVPAAASAQTPSPTGAAGEEQKEGRFEERCAELNLTAEQIGQLKAQREANKEAMRELRRALKRKQRQLKAELARQNPDSGRVEAITAEQKRLEAQLIDQRVKNILQIKATLTPEQFTKLSALEDELSKQRRAMRKLQRAIKTKREDLGDELDKQDPDKGRIESITSELKRLEAERVDQKVKVIQMQEALRPSEKPERGPAKPIAE